MRKKARFPFVFAQNRAIFRSFSTVFTFFNRRVVSSGIAFLLLKPRRKIVSFQGQWQEAPMRCFT
jgi:hypothetical protein